MINEQAAIYSSVVFQWIVFASILVVIALLVKRKLEAVAANLNKTANYLEQQIIDAEKNLSKLQTDLLEVEQNISELDQTLNEGNQTLEEVAIKIHEIVAKINQTIVSLNKTKTDLLSKFKF